MRPFVTIQVVPTGLGAALGGFAGDATPATNLLAAASDVLITHPNAVNAATWYAARPNVLYVEGLALDRFCLGEWALRPVRSNRVGLLLDAALDATARIHLLNATEAARAVWGLAVSGIRTTEEPVASRLVLDTSGASHGELNDPQGLVAAARALVEEGAEAIAVVTRMPELPELETTAYLEGRGPDPIGGLEAVISHWLTRELRVPCAHAPYEPPSPAQRVDPRVAAEWIGHTYLPCILAGLQRAPRLVPMEEREPGDLAFTDVAAVVAPWGACGGVPMLAAVARGKALIAVRGNPVVTTADPVSLGLSALEAASYPEAAGYLLALREGIAPDALRRPLFPL